MTAIARAMLVTMPIPFDESVTLPLETDLDIERRVADLIGRATSRQLWLLFLDDGDVQLPLVIPIEGLPTEPPTDGAHRVGGHVREVMDEIGASAVVTVIERYGPATLTVPDAAWVRALRAGFADHDVRLRGQLLSHRTGVRWIAEDDALA